jgi:hypothetical protein
MMSSRREPETLMRYDHDRENLSQNLFNFPGYEEV